MNVVVGTTHLAVNVALTYEDGSIVDTTELDSLSLWVRSGKGRYRGSYVLATDGTDGLVTFELDEDDLSDKRGPKVSWQFEVGVGGNVIWTEAGVVKLLPRS
jgi:hypothetical protein